ncbi:bifunctional enoyl-CoA hydratase/phosphate acetyltransferase [Aminipila butyrica]|uniref:Bifunctional enoyl-CoA hydratase/phosphate acetyltransferase n=1 Tax=Aminipila butyrica TaxID=433296 RepID=A0A858BVK6_9FIRM|nr:bifunctional enoyl-CoA hydratase/phosphate acetyltransferase [Aminipila butyrica]QIB68940.1 bifunctional enoyl-CoA hydratase/phosphate acetyltransferase [Aminipila butyrica]
MKDFNELIQLVQERPQKKKVAVAGAHDEHTLEGVYRAFEQGLVEPVLIGDRQEIIEIMEREGFSFPVSDIIDIRDEQESAKRAVELIREGQADFLMKGKLQTADLLKQVVHREHGLKDSEVMSHVGLFEVPGCSKLLVITDGGMLPHPDLQQKVRIVENAVKLLKNLGYDTVKVAALAAAEVVNPKLKESTDGAELKRMNQEGLLTDCLVEGPISYDLMISEEAARIKGYGSPITGDTDILLVPDMAAGNILAKALMYHAGARMAGVIVGAKVPIVLVSRGASSEEKFYSLALAAAVAR